MNQQQLQKLQDEAARVQFNELAKAVHKTDIARLKATFWILVLCVGAVVFTVLAAMMW